MYGLGTVINVVAILVGASIGVLLGHRLPERTRVTVTDALGLVTLVIGGLNVVALQDQAFVDAVGRGIPLLIVIGALLFGGITGSLLQIERRLEALGGWLQRRLAAGNLPGSAHVSWRVSSTLRWSSASDRWRCWRPQRRTRARHRRTDAQSDARRIRLDRLRRVSGLGWRLLPCRSGSGRDCSRCWQFCWDPSCPDAFGRECHGHRRSAAAGVGLRLLNIKAVPVGDMLPALILAPVLTAGVMALT